MRLSQYILFFKPIGFFVLIYLRSNNVSDLVRFNILHIQPKLHSQSLLSHSLSLSLSLAIYLSIFLFSISGCGYFKLSQIRRSNPNFSEDCNFVVTTSASKWRRIFQLSAVSRFLQDFHELGDHCRNNKRFETRKDFSVSSPIAISSRFSWIGWPLFQLPF